MSTVARELGVPGELLELLERLDLRYEVIDGEIVVNASPTFGHEDGRSGVFLALANAVPDECAVLAEFAFFYDALARGNRVNHTVADITVVRRSEVEEQGAVHPPLLVLEVLSPSNSDKDVQFKRHVYERSGIPTYLLLEPLRATLTVLELRDGSYVQTQQRSAPEVVRLERPFPVDIDLGRVFRS